MRKQRDWSIVFDRAEWSFITRYCLELLLSAVLHGLGPVHLESTVVELGPDNFSHRGVARMVVEQCRPFIEAACVISVR